MTDATRCSLNDAMEMSPCPIMAKSLGAWTRKGLSVLTVTRLNDGRRRDVGVTYKCSPSDRGVMLNVCPWCRAEILWEKAPDEGT